MVNGKGPKFNLKKKSRKLPTLARTMRTNEEKRTLVEIRLDARFASVIHHSFIIEHFHIFFVYILGFLLLRVTVRKNQNVNKGCGTGVR